MKNVEMIQLFCKLNFILISFKLRPLFSFFYDYLFTKFRNIPKVQKNLTKAVEHIDNKK